MGHVEKDVLLGDYIPWGRPRGPIIHQGMHSDRDMSITKEPSGDTSAVQHSQERL